jgi:two-component system chemotaxis response regulator CheY
VTILESKQRIDVEKGGRGVLMIKKILIVDDSGVARKILKSCLPKDRGFELSEAVDGSEAIKKYQEFSPDVTFMDLTMPVMDGLQALEKIMELDSKALIVVSSADIQKRTVDRVMELGAFMMIKKPPSKEIINNVLLEVHRYLETSR